MADFDTDMPTEAMIARMRTLSHSDYQAAATRLEKLTVEIEQLTKMLKEANMLLRSCHSVAKREGDATNWPALKTAVRRQLELQHPVLYGRALLPDKEAETTKGNDKDGYYREWAEQMPDGSEREQEPE